MAERNKDRDGGWGQNKRRDKGEEKGGHMRGETDENNVYNNDCY